MLNKGTSHTKNFRCFKEKAPYKFTEASDDIGYLIYGKWQVEQSIK